MQRYVIGTAKMTEKSDDVEIYYMRRGAYSTFSPKFHPRFYHTNELTYEAHSFEDVIKS